MSPYQASLRRLRVIGAIEGTSFLLLLLIAMPLKYLADQPQMVTIVGSAHGVLWILYLAALLHSHLLGKWPFARLFMGGVASVLPFGPFVFDARVTRATEAEA